VTGRYEQFAGYFGLESLSIADIAQPPVAADVLLGRDRVAASQVIKQPDVLMLHHLVPEEVAPGSLEPNLDFYGPRTAHGSSLSPAIHAALLARAGRADEALEPLRIALALDLEDLTGTTAAGLHLATLGGVWQAVLAGFAGVRVRDGVLGVDPRLPTSWRSLELRFRCLGRRVRLLVTPDGTDVHTSRPLQVRLAGQAPRRVAGHTRLTQTRRMRGGDQG
jgi:trehalose/maltose hydrolase-like predicted phosphorylase